MDEFCVGDLVGPGTWVASTEDPKICFNFLVDMFCFAVGLRMIGGGQGEVVVKKFSEFLSKGRGKL